MGMNELSESIHNDRDIFAKAVRRAKVNGVEEFDRYGVIVFLEKEIMGYREKINHMERVFDAQNRIVAKLKRCSCTNDPTTCEAVQQSATAGEIIKALADNGYNTITINCYKTESEE